jgi:large repetitive protein
VSVETATTGDDGVWQFGAMPIRQTYEVHFAKEGYDSQSFVVTPTDDGEPVDLEVVLEPASGAVGGRVFGPGGPRGGVEIVVTDGTLRFTATTSTAPGSTGTWTIGGVSTPGEYTVTASANGLGTEVIQVGLAPGEQRTDLRINMVAGVGSIGGHVSFAGNPLSGVTLQATNGELTRTTSSLTDGDPGSYFFPKLAVPAEWTVTVSGDGFVTQTQRVTLDGNASGVDFDLVRTTASVTGIVVSDSGQSSQSLGARQAGGHTPLPGASITIARDKLSFRTVSAVAPDTGSFSVGDLPPGT